jgi:hypothetical protein
MTFYEVWQLSPDCVSLKKRRNGAQPALKMLFKGFGGGSHHQAKQEVSARAEVPRFRICSTKALLATVVILQSYDNTCPVSTEKSTERAKEWMLHRSCAVSITFANYSCPSSKLGKYSLHSFKNSFKASLFAVLL